MNTSTSVEEREQRVALFDQLFELHRRPLYAFHLSRVGDAEKAADLLQETFMRAWRAIESLAPLSADEQRFWLFRVARNLAVDEHRRVQPMVQPWDESAILVSSERDPLDTVEAREFEARLQQAIFQLPTDLRVVLLLHVMGDMNSIEISKALGKPAGTVRYHLSEARRRLAQCLQTESS